MPARVVVMGDFWSGYVFDGFLLIMVLLFLERCFEQHSFFVLVRILSARAVVLKFFVLPLAIGAGRHVAGCADRA